MSNRAKEHKNNKEVLIEHARNKKKIWKSQIQKYARRKKKRPEQY